MLTYCPQTGGKMTDLLVNVTNQTFIPNPAALQNWSQELFSDLVERIKLE